MIISILPMLSVRRGVRAVEFYKAAFGAIEVYRLEDPGGAVVSRLSVAGAEFWVSDESPEHGNFSPEALGGGTVRMILTVPDPDAFFVQALAAGAQEAMNFVLRAPAPCPLWIISEHRGRSHHVRLTLETGGQIHGSCRKWKKAVECRVVDRCQQAWR